MRRFLGLLAGATLLATATATTACRDGRADTAATSTTGAPTSTSIASVPEVVLLDPGAEPRSPLRIRYAAGDQVTIDLTLDQAIDQNAGRTTNEPFDLTAPQRFDSPPITHGVTYTVGTVDEDGRATFTVEITSAHAQTEGTELTEAASLLLEAELQPLIGLTGEGMVDGRGVVDRFAMDLPQDLEPDLAEQIAMLDRQLSSFGPSLPREAVGAGARWDIIATAAFGGVEVTTTTTYTLTERTDATMSYTATISGSADPQPINVPGLDAAQAELRSSTAQGTSTGTQSLTGLAFTLRTELSTSQVIDITGLDPVRTFKQTIETDLAARTAAS